MNEETTKGWGLAGVRGDFRRRSKVHLRDWTDGLHAKVAAATGFLFSPARPRPWHLAP